LSANPRRYFFSPFQYHLLALIGKHAPRTRHVGDHLALVSRLGLLRERLTFLGVLSVF
jgi:hypothetical protein